MSIKVLANSAEFKKIPKIYNKDMKKSTNSRYLFLEQSIL